MLNISKTSTVLYIILFYNSKIFKSNKLANLFGKWLQFKEKVILHKEIKSLKLLSALYSIDQKTN